MDSSVLLPLDLRQRFLVECDIANRRARMARRGIRVSGAQPASREGAIPEARERKAAAVMTIVFFIIGLSVILSYDWGSPTPQFRQDAGLVILLGILISAIITSRLDMPRGVPAPSEWGSGSVRNAVGRFGSTPRSARTAIIYCPRADMTAELTPLATRTCPHAFGGSRWSRSRP